MYGCKRPAGLPQRTYTLDPSGNCERAEAARQALLSYAHILAKSSHPRLLEESRMILEWVDAEILYANTMRTISEINEN